MRSNTRVFRLLILFFSATMLLTSCGSVEKKEEVFYERLTPDQNISNVVINGDVANFVQLFDYLLPGYEKVEICFDEYNKIYENHEVKNNVLYIYDKKCSPDPKENSSIFLFVHNNLEYSILFWKTKKNDLLTGKHDESCFWGNKITIDDEYYGVQIYAFTDEDMTTDDPTDFYAKSEYCPDKKEFDNEYLQYSNLIFDSVDLIKK